jgi:hypothetical protein
MKITQLSRKKIWKRKAEPESRFSEEAYGVVRRRSSARTLRTIGPAISAARRSSREDTFHLRDQYRTSWGWPV